MWQLINLLPIIIYWKDISNKFIGCNYICSQIFGLSDPEQIADLDTSDIVDSQLTDHALHLDGEVLSTGESKICESDKYSISKFPLKKTGGKIKGMLSASFNVEGYKQTLYRKDNQIKLLDDIVSNLPGHVYWKDINCILLGCNEKQALDAGFESRHEIPGKTAYDLLWKVKSKKSRLKQAKITDDIDKRIMRHGEPELVEEFVINEKGEEVFYLTEKRPLKNQKGEVNGLVGVSIDITDKHKLKQDLIEKNEELKLSSAEKEKTLEKLFQFVQDQEHDIRTPMTGLIGSAEILQLARDRGLDMNSELVSGSIDDMVISGNELLSYQESVIFDLYGDVSEGNTIFRRFDLKEIVERVFNLNRSSARSKSLDYSLNFDSDVPRYLKADGKKIYQCLVDVLSNAIRFTEDGTVSLSVQLIDKKDNKAIIRFLIKDTGIGIPEDLQHRIYEEYFKVKPSNKGGKHGRGLGLTRAFRYVNSVNGEIDFTSKVGEGTSFRVVLPLLISLDQSDS